MVNIPSMEASAVRTSSTRRNFTKNALFIVKSLSTPFKQLIEQFPTAAPGVDYHLIGTYFLPWKNHVMVHCGICARYEAYDDMSTKI